MNGAERQGFRQRMQRVESLVQTLERIADPAACAAARELIQTLLDLHRAGLERMIQFCGAAETWATDEVVCSLLLLHGLHPVDLPTRVQQALEQVRPLLRSHGMEVELLAAPGDIIRLRLRGTCEGGPSSLQGLFHAIEEAICEAVPDARVIEMEGPASPRMSLPLVQGSRPLAGSM